VLDYVKHSTGNGYPVRSWSRTGQAVPLSKPLLTSQDLVEGTPRLGGHTDQVRNG
jgi:hypothetical protein